MESRRGAKLAVRELGKSQTTAIVEDLDDLIANFITVARRSGYTPRQLGLRIQDQLLGQPSDHVLVVTAEKALARLLAMRTTELLDPANGLALLADV